MPWGAEEDRRPRDGTHWVVRGHHRTAAPRARSPCELGVGGRIVVVSKIALRQRRLPRCARQLPQCEAERRRARGARTRALELARSRRDAPPPPTCSRRRRKRRDGARRALAAFDRRGHRRQGCSQGQHRGLSQHRRRHGRCWLRPRSFQPSGFDLAHVTHAIRSRAHASRGRSSRATRRSRTGRSGCGRLVRAAHRQGQGHAAAAQLDALGRPRPAPTAPSSARSKSATPSRSSSAAAMWATGPVCNVVAATAQLATPVPMNGALGVALGAEALNERARWPRRRRRPRERRRAVSGPAASPANDGRGASLQARAHRGAAVPAPAAASAATAAAVGGGARSRVAKLQKMVRGAGAAEPRRPCAPPASTSRRRRAPSTARGSRQAGRRRSRRAAASPRTSFN